MSGDSEVGVDDADAASTDATLVAFAQMPNDPTGIGTFQRFRWQAKLAVRAWLQVLAGAVTVAVVCEHVEDLAIVEVTGFRFAQLKTRDKGSWSASKICASGHAIERLVASYKHAEAAKIVALSRFEVWLEGPPSEDKDTTAFFANPAGATEAIKRKIRGFGLTGRKLSDFLSRLTVHCHQPARQSVDAVNVRAIGAIWPALPMQQVEALYEKLLAVAEAAQSASEPPASVRNVLMNARGNPGTAAVWEPIISQSLTREQLQSLCPPLPTDSNEDLIARAAAGDASILELKLVRAGANPATVKQALLARADSDIAATSARAAGSMTPVDEAALDQRLIGSATSLAALASSNGSTQSRPAEFVFHSLMSNTANTAALDVDGLYNRDPRLIVGHLCGVSDACRYGWGVS